MQQHKMRHSHRRQGKVVVDTTLEILHFRLLITLLRRSGNESQMLRGFRSFKCLVISSHFFNAPIIMTLSVYSLPRKFGSLYSPFNLKYFAVICLLS